MSGRTHPTPLAAISRTVPHQDPPSLRAWTARRRGRRLASRRRTKSSRISSETPSGRKRQRRRSSYAAGDPERRLAPPTTSASRDPASEANRPPSARVDLALARDRGQLGGRGGRRGCPGLVELRLRDLVVLDGIDAVLKREELRALVKSQTAARPLSATTTVPQLQRELPQPDHATTPLPAPAHLAPVDSPAHPPLDC